MRRTFLRVLKNGIPTAAILAAIGYLMAEVAVIWIASQSPARPGVQAGGDSRATAAPTDNVGAALRYRLPLGMAGWGFGLVCVFELVLSLWRGKEQPPAPAPARRMPLPTEDEVEVLLNQLLLAAEASEAARKAKAAEPPAPPCPTEPPADNTPVSH